MTILSRSKALICVCYLVLFTPSVKADFVAPTVLKNKLSPALLAPDYIGKINDQSLGIYDERFEGGAFFAYRPASNTVEKLFSASTRDYVNGALVENGNGGALIGVLGELYFSKGTADTTVKIASLGTAEVGGAVSVLISVFDRPFFHNGFFYLHDFAFMRREEGKPFRLWRTSGNSGSLQSITLPDGFLVRRVFPSPARDGGVLVYGRDSANRAGFLELKTKSTEATPVIGFGAFGDNADFSIVSNGVLLRRGLILCISDDRDGDNALWRIARNFESDRMSDDFGRNLVKLKDKTYFIKGIGDASGMPALWQTSGLASETAKVANLVAGQSMQQPDKIDGLCATDASVAVRGVFTRSNQRDQRAIWRSDGTNAGTSLIQDQSTDLDNKSLVCLDNILATDRFFIEDDAGDIAPVKPSKDSLGFWQLGDFILGAAFIVSGDSSIENRFELISHEIKPGNFVGYLPALLQLFEENEEANAH